MVDHKREELADAWSSLPQEIISEIERCLKSRVDVCRLRSVCKTWWSSRQPNNISLLSPLLPLVISNASLPFTDRPQVPVILVARAVLLVKPLYPSPPSCGWLLTVEEMVPGKLRILYPLSSDPVKHLPSNCPKHLDLSKFRVSQVAKSYGFKYESDGQDVLGVSRVALCSGDTVMVLYGRGTLIGISLKSGDWRFIRDSIISSFLDVISYGENHARGFDCKGNMHIIDHKVMKVLKTISCKSHIYWSYQKNIFTSNGKLFAVACYPSSLEAYKFSIYLLDEVEHKWMDVGNTIYCGKVFFVSSDWNFFIYNCDLELCYSSPQQKMTQGSGNQKNAMGGDSVIYSGKSFDRAYGSYGTSRLYERASLDLAIGVFFFNSQDAGFWESKLHSTTIDMLWPPPNWFWSDTCPSIRENIELDNHSQNASLSSTPELLPSCTRDTSTRAVIANNQEKFTSFGKSHVVTSLTTKNLNQNSSEMVPKGANAKANLVLILRKIREKYGDISEGSIIRNADMIGKALESLATTVLILQSSSGSSLNKDQADYLSSALYDLQQMKFKVGWLVPFVEKALLVHRSQPVIDSLKDLSKIKAQAEDMKLKVLDEFAKLDDGQDDELLVSERLALLEAIDFEQSLGDGLC